MAGTPQRTCIGCRRVVPQDELVRIVRTPAGLANDRTAPGRGAWLCAGSAACLDEADRKKAFARALRSDVSGEDITTLRGELAW